jgi:sulfur transfer complex TusBCD TusB component (DsrH family)
MAKILSIAERAYHGTIEEQDDTILWMTHILKKGGADISLLLRGNAVNYSVRGQDASGLSFGGVKMEVGPKIDRDLAEIVKAGIPTYVVREDLEDRGISQQEIARGVKLIGRREIAGLFDSHDSIWHW